MMDRYCRCLLVLAATLLGVVQAGFAQADALYTVQLRIKDGHFYPETLRVPAGVRFKIAIHNEGPEAEEFESLPLRKEKVLAPGAKSFVVIAPLKPGTYAFFGEFHPATAQGRIVAD